MIVLDTNVVSATMRAEPEPAVVAWLDRQPPEAVWTTAVTVFEVRTGLALLPPSRRRERLEAAFQLMLARDLLDRVLAFDQAAANEAGLLAARRRREGRPMELRDTQIAGIAATRDAILATRNTRHFQDLGIELVDPWQAG